MPGPNLHTENTAYINALLQQDLPTTERKSVKQELLWNFVLDKHTVNAKKKTHGRKQLLSRKQRKKLGLEKIPKTSWDYESLQAVRDMWIEYMRENIGKPPRNGDWSGVSTTLGKSEFVGAELSVVKSTVPTLVGVSGTVVLETKNMFQIVTKDNKLKS